MARWLLAAFAALAVAALITGSYVLGLVGLAVLVAASFNMGG